jgi:hypothetical protein
MDADGRAERPMTDHGDLGSRRVSESGDGFAVVKAPFFLFVLPVVAVILFGGMLTMLVPEMRVAYGHGDPGTFTAERVHCTKGKFSWCKWQGDFIAADGRTRRNDVLITGIGTRDLKRGGRIQAIDVGSSSDVYPRKARYEWTGPVIGLLVALGMMLVSLAGWRSWFRTRRVARSQ